MKNNKIFFKKGGKYNGQTKKVFMLSRREKGEGYTQQEVKDLTKQLSKKEGSVVLYVDGSSMPHEKNSSYGYGFVVVDNNEIIYEESGVGNNP